jgi:putative nucleotidyltransferase with HDIG domain
MMNNPDTAPVTREIVIAGSRSLPSFPSVVTLILATLDDPHGSMPVLSRAINLDPLISARVISVVNTVAVRGARDTEVCDINTAISLIGMNRVRHIALISSLNTFVAGAARVGLPRSYWQHSVAVGICCEELAVYTGVDVSPSMALMAGLLHDIGQLWLHHYNPAKAQACRDQAREQTVDVEQIEREQFGQGHSDIGAWLLHYWSLPDVLVDAVRAHHDGVPQPNNPLVALLHVAEVLSNALDLTVRAENRVISMSQPACEQLALVWDASTHPLFGRIESRARHANTIFGAPTP